MFFSYQSTGKFSAFLIESVNMGGKRLEIRDDKLLPEGLG